MATVDLEKLKARLASLNGSKNDSQLLKFQKPGKITVRIIDAGDAPEGDLFPCREFISLGMDRYVISNNPQLKNEINKLQTKFFDLAGKRGTPKFDEDFFELAKKLYPSTNWYARVIVRGEEAKGVQVWKLNKGVYTELVEAFVDEDVGDFTHPKTGYDVDITVEKGGNGNYHFASSCKVARKSTPLSTDPEMVKKWFADAKEVNIDDLHRKAIRSDEEIMAAIEAFVSGGVAGQDGKETSDASVMRDTSKELDELADEIAPPKAKKAVKQDDDEDTTPVKAKADLDAEFDEIMADD